ncbi:hypothetical protein FFJ24_010350 [Pedobacter sp. KBS0701]|uniref:hypothetical protein n=1 Tax=Pedobacter sp. KBS0701 TaxID=2578106 RepID=UPI00110F29E9|nr:hypothetical protein [Pedobacter sp. KBS0701]QDW25189.1 hypothetical protein FFJ24_010350 [Pedobacter sp. KBS0701]
MKDKKMTYLLICCVAVVWGVIFYRVFSGLASETPELPVAKTLKGAYFKLVDHAGDTVQLDLSYSDPFSEAYTETLTEMLPERSALISRPHVVPLKPKTDWSGIVYSGQLYNSAQRRHVAIINVNGREVMLGEGERGEGLKFIKRIGDSIKVEYQGASRYLSIIR